MTETETSIEALGLAVCSIDDEATLDLIGTTLDKLKFIKEQVSIHEKELKERIIQYILSHGGDGIQIGHVRYYVGPDKDTKCNNIRDTTAAVLDASGGSVDDFTCTLSTNAFKPGACKKLLGVEKFNSLFTVTERKRLKQDGTEEKQLQSIDERFVNQK